ncbi:gamma-glutamyl-gamma-aminobutyrate hydrolase family protein [Robbsia sp. Bb-Pol-6]|uniref:CTP synthase (glutamine hydrolyzing) n=1 Tax=Robbsia betulipollinis TaxID=2981849 RepID=A0ABT3ZI14_9BURK|nr:gamma-glutamyl-gamma-aminobutyrate hydrolase family protein [Robbsia betulipollinis]MCY0386164.1 gamma-glutamyl-gamma-aminobutyrate hydrolase family protein [Robbsia betulipollinis]
MLYLVEDDSDLPARYGALAALLADALHATLWPAPAALDEARFPDAVQFVTRDRGLAPSGLIWAERLGVLRAPCGDAPAAARERDIVVPLHPRVMGDGVSAAAWRRQADGQDVPVRHCRVLRAGDAWRVVDVATGLAIPGLDDCRQDDFGRWSAAPPGADSLRRAPRIVHGEPARLCIALIGSEAGQREGYPATLAALGDALDAARIDSATLDLRFVAPGTLSPAGAPAALAGCDGILLPGGADMRAVPGQVRAARHGWLSGTPVVGLCLGMQTMATAVLQVALGTDDVGLTEVDANVRVPSFVPMRADPPAASEERHRVGEHRMQVVDGSHLRTILDGEHGLRYNHRYRFNAALHPALTAAGLNVVARDDSGQIVDAIEARDHPFFIGMQGHPEQSSTRHRPHPLLRAFVDAARAAAAR